MAPPASTTMVAPVALRSAKSTSAVSQEKKGKTSSKGAKPFAVGGKRLVHGAVAPADVDRYLSGMAAFIRIPKAVLVVVVEDRSPQLG